MLKTEISSGRMQEYADERIKEIKEMPEVACDLCMGSGFRDDAFMKGECNKCKGKGRIGPMEYSYPFSVQNVIDFAAFCIESGGFEIW